MSTLSLLCLLIFLQGFLAQQPISFLSRIVNFAISSTFNDTADELNIAVQSDLKENKVIFLDTVDNMLSDSWQFGIQVNVNNEIDRITSDYNLWLIDSYKAFLRLLSPVEAYHRDSQLYLFIVLRTFESEEHQMQELEKIFSDFLDLMIANVNVLIETTSGEVLFYTFYPFQKFASSCRSPKPFLAHRFGNETLIYKEEFFPPKADNFHGCPIRLRTNNKIVLEKTRKNLNIGHYASTEMAFLETVLLKEFALRINFTLEVYTTPVFAFEGANISAISYFQQCLIRNDKIDILLGFFFNNPVYDHVFSKSVPYFMSWLIIALCPRTNTLRTFAWILEPFAVATWIYIVVSFSLIIGCITLVRKCAYLQKIFQLRQPKGLEILSIAIGAPVFHLPRENFLRFCIVVLIFGAFILRSAHQGKLFDAFRGHIMLNPPRSIGELFAENYTIYSHSYYRSIINEINEMEYLNLRELQFLNGMDYNKLFEEGKLNAFVSSYAQFYPFYTAKQRSSLRIAPIIRQQVCVFFQQHSVIQPKINEIIVRLEEAGILHYFRRGFENLKDSGAIALDKRGEEPKQLDLERFGFLFYFGIVLYGISCLVFVLELLWTKILLMLTK